MKKQSMRLVGLVMSLVLLCSFVPCFAVTSSAAPKGTQTYSVTETGGLPAAVFSINMNSASYVSGDTVTYYVDRSYYTNLSQLGNVYSITFGANGVRMSSGISASGGYAVSNGYGNSDTWITNDIYSNSGWLSTTVDGSISGAIPAAGQSVSFTITVSLSVTYLYSGYYLTSSGSRTVTIVLVGVDTGNLRALASGSSQYRSSCWTSSTWSNFSSALSNANSVASSVTADQNTINSAYNNLKSAKSALVHNGQITECSYCLGGSIGNVSSGVISIKDVVYGNDSTRNSMDLYLPQNRTGNCALIIYIHGGAWFFGAKEIYTSNAYNACAKYGIATLAINYRYTSPDVHGLDILDDITGALTMAKSVAAQYGLNLTKLMTTGHSAGAHLAMLYAYRMADVSPIKPVCCFETSGPTNLMNECYWDSSLGDSTISFCFTCMSNQPVYDRATQLAAYASLQTISPIYNVTENSVPTIICHGQKDDAVDYSEAQYIASALYSKGVPFEFISFPNSNHDLQGDPSVLTYADSRFDNMVNTYLLDATPVPVHNFVAEVTPKTCTTDGYIMYSCTDCGQYYLSSIVKASHDSVADEGYSATCTQAGLTDGAHCSACNEILTAQQVIPANGHNPSENVRENDTAPTCAEYGGYDDVVYCTVCGDEISRVHTQLDKTAHNEGQWETTVPSTYVSQGAQVRICETCGQIVETRSIPVLEPEYGVKDNNGVTLNTSDSLLMNVPQGTGDISQYLTLGGCTVETTDETISTGSTVTIKNLAGETLATYTAVVGGDVTGDGYVDAFDLALAGEYINTFTEPEDAAYMSAVDMFEDGFLDATDLAYLIYIANFEE